MTEDRPAQQSPDMVVQMGEYSPEEVAAFRAGWRAAIAAVVNAANGVVPTRDGEDQRAYEEGYEDGWEGHKRSERNWERT